MDQKHGDPYPGYPPLPGQQPPPQPGMFPPQPPAYDSQPPPPQPQATVTVMQTALGPDSSSTVCPSCHAQIRTRVVYEASTRTHIIAGILCLVGCWICCCIPYCVDSCQNGNHYCPNCNSYLGTFKS